MRRHKAAPSPAGRSTAASTLAPTAAPLTAAELAWIAGVTNQHQKVDKPFRASSMTMTRAKMTELSDALRACHRELRRMGAPGTRLQPVYVMVTKACRALGRGARCFAGAASVSDAAGGTVAGTMEARTQNRSLSCGFAAQGNGSNLLTGAEAQAWRSRPTSRDGVARGHRMASGSTPNQRIQAPWRARSGTPEAPF